MHPPSRSSAPGVLEQITPLVLTFDEAPNLCRCLERLAWARRVVVLDSGSTDGTQAIAGRFPNVDIHERPFDTHTQQWNFGLSLVRTPWALTLDADYVLNDAFLENIRELGISEDISAIFAPFRYCIFGQPLRGSLYPPRAVLFRPDRCRYEPDGHTQRLAISGRTATLAATIDHDDRKPLTRWLISQDNYAKLEAEKLVSLPRGSRRFKDRLRRTIVLGPLLVLPYTLFVKGAILDGWPGWYYALQRTLAELMVSLHILDRQLRSRPSSF